MDYNTCVNGLPKANVIEFDLEGGNKGIVRPSGTEPKIKLYIFAKGADEAEADAALDSIDGIWSQAVGLRGLKSYFHR